MRANVPKISPYTLKKNERYLQLLIKLLLNDNRKVMSVWKEIHTHSASKF